MKANKKPVKLLFFAGTFFLVFVLFFPAFFNFYSHDDFFHYKIARASSIKDFLSFFDLRQGPENWGYYRPLATQVLYFIVRSIFRFNPIVMHSIAFLLFFIVIVLVYKFVEKMTNNRSVAYFSALFYSTSSAHFSHLYSVANQELLHAVFFLSSTLAFINYLEKKKNRHLLISLICFALALTCKEFAVMLPPVLLLVYGFLKILKKIKTSFINYFFSMLPFGFILSIYLYLHIFQYGLVQGDSYIWVITPKVFANSVMWYGLWSLNLPKILMNFDFINSNIIQNIKLAVSSSPEMPYVFALFALLLLLLAAAFGLSLKKTTKKDVFTYIFSSIWFVCILLPVIFLPWHKFTTYLTIPLIGVVTILGQLLDKARSHLILKKRKKPAEYLIFTIFATYIALSAITLDIARKVDWIGTGPRIARRVYDYLEANYADLDQEITMVFYDTPAEANLKLKPSNEVKLALSGDNFFAVFYPGKIRAEYISLLDEDKQPVKDGSDGKTKEKLDKRTVIKVPARQFVDY